MGSVARKLFGLHESRRTGNKLRLIERTRVRKALHPDSDPTEKWFETRLTDFRSVDGVLRSFKSVEVDLESAAVVQTTAVKEVVTNPSLESSVFQRPG